MRALQFWMYSQEGDCRAFTVHQDNTRQMMVRHIASIATGRFVASNGSNFVVLPAWQGVSFKSLVAKTVETARKEHTWQLLAVTRKTTASTALLEGMDK